MTNVQDDDVKMDEQGDYQGDKPCDNQVDYQFHYLKHQLDSIDAQLDDLIKSQRVLEKQRKEINHQMDNVMKQRQSVYYTNAYIGKGIFVDFTEGLYSTPELADKYAKKNGGPNHKYGGIRIRDSQSISSFDRLDQPENPF